jgi:hypothetical protein
LNQYLINEHQAEFIASASFRLKAGLRNFSSTPGRILPAGVPITSSSCSSEKGFFSLMLQKDKCMIAPLIKLGKPKNS